MTDGTAWPGPGTPAPDAVIAVPDALIADRSVNLWQWARPALAAAVAAAVKNDRQEAGP